MPAVSEAQRRLFASVLAYQQNGGHTTDRVKRLASSIPQETVKDFTTLAPGVKPSRALFPQYAGSGPSLSKELRDAVKQHTSSEFNANTQVHRDLKIKKDQLMELAIGVAGHKGVELPVDKLKKVRTLGNLQHLLNNGIHKAANFLRSSRLS